jgi:hypothetical protein
MALVALPSCDPQVASAQQPAVPVDLVIRLERTACYGTCPVYSVTIDGKGAVSFQGKAFVRAQGRQTDRIPLSSVAAIVATAKRIGFFELRNSYRAMITDLPTTFVTITMDGRTKRIEDYHGAPKELTQLESEIDEAARTRRWIH